MMTREQGLFFFRQSIRSIERLVEWVLTEMQKPPELGILDAAVARAEKADAEASRSLNDRAIALVDLETERRRVDALDLELHAMRDRLIETERQLREARKRADELEPDGCRTRDKALEHLRRIIGAHHGRNATDLALSIFDANQWLTTGRVPYEPTG